MSKKLIEATGKALTDDDPKQFALCMQDERQSFTPDQLLSNAAQHNKPLITSWLLANTDANPNLSTTNGDTLLIAAIKNRHPLIVQELLGHPDIDPNLEGANAVTQGGPRKATPLRVAIEQENIYMVELLKKHKKTTADPHYTRQPTAVANADYTPARLIKNNDGLDRIVKETKSTAMQPRLFEKNITPTAAATRLVDAICRLPNPEDILSIIESTNPKHLSSASASLITPLQAALEFDRYDIAQALIKKGANEDSVRDMAQYKDYKKNFSHMDPKALRAETKRMHGP